MDIQEDIDNRSYCVVFSAHEDGQKVGFARLYVIYNDMHEEPYGIFEYVFVKKEYQGRGIGSTLIDRVIEEAKRRGCYKLVAFSRFERTEAHAMYLRRGFQEWGKEFRMDLKESKQLHEI